MKINDKNFRDAKPERHPQFEPWLAFNDVPGPKTTIIFKSCYEDAEYCKKQWGVVPIQMHANVPSLYYYPEKPENKLITVPINGFARLPHSFYRVFFTGDQKGSYRVKSETDL